MLRILHLEDSDLDHELVQLSLRKSGLEFSMDRVETLVEFRLQIEKFAFDVILADYRLPGFTALDAWEALSDQSHRPPFILLSGAIGESAAVAAIKLGMSDYLLKDDTAKLAQVIRRAIEVQDARRAKEKADAELAASERRLANFAEHLQSTIEQERAAIAREIHDDIGGALAAVKLDLSWIERHTSDPVTQSHIDAATEMLQHALGASQRIMMNLRPAILDQGLEAAVYWLAGSFEKRTGIRTAFRANLAKEVISKEVQLTAYRTAQEALTNISKYAQCDQVTIDLTDAEDVLTLEVSDNGIGITPSNLDKAKAFGLKGLSERAKSVGGWLDVSCPSGIGTSIILSVPLTPVPLQNNQDTFQ
ncbi:MAG: response regulator [Gammaproteobacteria bacterium]|nr:response regulator [Gammaproteobacteria bacterium]MBU0785880.1 response regulator [Gammaproteobacteria bacterium]MBU0816493.1 response regulator [Gammaproteobacteria bacterium]MBU1788294.1 response regulator [Gammaproteobacteria bacterium]